MHWSVGIVTLKNRMVSPVVQTFISMRGVAKPMIKAGAAAG